MRLNFWFFGDKVETEIDFSVFTWRQKFLEKIPLLFFSTLPEKSSPSRAQANRRRVYRLPSSFGSAICCAIPPDELQTCFKNKRSLFLHMQHISRDWFIAWLAFFSLSFFSNSQMHRVTMISVSEENYEICTKKVEVFIKSLQGDSHLRFLMSQYSVFLGSLELGFCWLKFFFLFPEYFSSGNFSQGIRIILNHLFFIAVLIIWSS